MTLRLTRRGALASGLAAAGGTLAAPAYAQTRERVARIWGEPDDRAWERAHAHYLGQFTQFSDIQDERPLPLPELEAACGCC